MEGQQKGFRGVAMQQIVNPRIEAALISLNQLPEAIDKVDPAGQKSSEVYQNVQVLGDVDANEFIRLMSAITAWVSPEQGCAYCHNVENMAEDSVYTKIVARRMLQMTREINANWKTHVATTGVTCYTCHRGMPVPANIWFQHPPQQNGAVNMWGYRGGQTAELNVTGQSSLPFDPFSPYLEQTQQIRVVAGTPLPEGHVSSMQATETTYALMMHMSKSLNVNCGFCHNTRAFQSWEQSTPQRVTAWYGIRMVRVLNDNYLDPLTPTFPEIRLGPNGDAAKINCATCHQGVGKPLLGVSMVSDYEELRGPGPTPANLPGAPPNPDGQPYLSRDQLQ